MTRGVQPSAAAGKRCKAPAYSTRARSALGLLSPSALLMAMPSIIFQGFSHASGGEIFFVLLLLLLEGGLLGIHIWYVLLLSGAKDAVNSHLRKL